MKTCCFTGHRTISSADRDTIKDNLYKAVDALAAEGCTEFISGGARGFDTLAAIAVLAVRKLRPEIKLRLILPCSNQTEHWNEHDRMIYRYILEQADSSEVLHDAYINGCMQERNRKMIDSSDICIAYLKRNFGGTKFTVDYAIKRNKKVVYIT